MQKLSLLIFSKDCLDETLSLIKDMYDYVDEIVLIDQSRKKEFELIQKHKKNNKLGKLRLFYTVSLGYPDPLRMYALKKCRYDWVIFIDTDERLSDKLKSDLKELINRKVDAYAIKRYEEVKDPNNLPLFSTWQTRLFRKKSVEFMGTPHEQAIVKGKFKRIMENDCFMMHLSKMMNRKAQQAYGEIEKFERLTYKMQREKMLSYISKIDSDSSKAEQSNLTKLVINYMRLYKSITFKEDNQELSNFDYFMYYAMLDAVYYTLEGNLSGFFNIIPSEQKHIKQINRWQREKDGGKVLEISKIINEMGLIKFLGLEKESVIENLKRKYSYDDGGITLLMKLIYEKYDSMK
ncbi:MAG: glycosyltransferase [Candidatus Micrarchaeaceae archaeon]|jgi:hypothetical protein